MVAVDPIEFVFNKKLLRGQHRVRECVVMVKETNCYRQSSGRFFLTATHRRRKMVRYTS